MVPSEEITLNCDKQVLAAKVWGPPTGAPVLALHGWLDNAATYDLLAPRLSESRWVALDLPGHGLSPHRADHATYHFMDWIGDVMGAADALGWHRFTLVGHSMGGGVASFVAGSFPDRICRLVLLEALGPLSCEAEALPKRWVSHLQEMSRLKARKPHIYPTQTLAAQKLCAVVSRLSLNDAMHLMVRGTQAVAGGFVWSADPRLKGTAWLLPTEAQVQAFFKCIVCPVLWVRATDGYPFDRSILQARADLIQSLEIAEVPGGHHVHMEEAAQVASLLADFFQKHPAD